MSNTPTISKTIHRATNPDRIRIGEMEKSNRVGCLAAVFPLIILALVAVGFGTGDWAPVLGAIPFLGVVFALIVGLPEGKAVIVRWEPSDSVFVVEQTSNAKVTGTPYRLPSNSLFVTLHYGIRRDAGFVFWTVRLEDKERADWFVIVTDELTEENTMRFVEALKNFIIDVKDSG